MAAPPKPSLVKTWAVFGATAILLILVTLMSDQGMEKAVLWESMTRWFLGLLFGALGVTFSIQLVHCTALSSFWPSLVASLLVTVCASLAFLDRLSWGAGLGIGLLAVSAFGYKAFNGRGE